MGSQLLWRKIWSLLIHRQFNIKVLIFNPKKLWKLFRGNYSIAHSKTYDLIVQKRALLYHRRNVMYYVEVDSSNSRRYGTATCGSLCFDLFCDVISSTTLNVFIYNAAQKKKVSTNNKDSSGIHFRSIWHLSHYFRGVVTILRRRNYQVCLSKWVIYRFRTPMSILCF